VVETTLRTRRPTLFRQCAASAAAVAPIGIFEGKLDARGTACGIGDGTDEVHLCGNGRLLVE